MGDINSKLNNFFAGKVVRKDLTKLVKGNAIVPTYVLEYLLGQYCATDDEATINEGVENVKNIISKHFVHRDESQIIKSFQDAAIACSDNPWIQAGVVACMTVVIGSLLAYLVFSLLQAIAKRTGWKIDDHLIRILRFPVWYTVLLAGLLTAVFLMPLAKLTTTFWNNSLWSINVLIWTFAGIKALRVILQQLSDEENSFTLIQPGTLPLFYNSVFVIVVVTGIYSLSRIWAIDVTTWLASAGVVGIAVGFAAKDTLANLFAGIFILADAPYKIGDYIVLDNGDRGLVRHIGLRSTKLLTRDDVEITIPNSIISNSRIINQSGGPVKRFRLRIQFSVAYGTDVNQVRTLTTAIASAETLILQKPSPRLRFRRFEASGIAFELLCWVKLPALRGRATDRLNEAVYNAFLEEGIEIPNSKQDLYVKEMPTSAIRKNNL